MSYWVNEKGEIRAETLKEALALQAEILGKKPGEHQSKPRIPLNESGHSVWTDSRYKEFMSYMKGNQRTFLGFLIEHEHPKNDQSVRQALGIRTNRELSGVTAGLVKNAKKVGIPGNELFIREKRNLGNERVAEYKLTDGFRAMAEKMGDLAK